LILFFFSLCADFLAETEPGDAAFPVPAFPAAAAGPVQSGARAPGPAAAGDGAGASAQGAAAEGGSLLCCTGHAGDPSARPQGDIFCHLSPPLTCNVCALIFSFHLLALCYLSFDSSVPLCSTYTLISASDNSPHGLSDLCYFFTHSFY